jgi:hypothetical protein
VLAALELQSQQTAELKRAMTQGLLRVTETLSDTQRATAQFEHMQGTVTTLTDRLQEAREAALHASSELATEKDQHRACRESADRANEQLLAATTELGRYNVPTFKGEAWHTEMQALLTSMYPGNVVSLGGKGGEGHLADVHVKVPLQCGGSLGVLFEFKAGKAAVPSHLRTLTANAARNITVKKRAVDVAVLLYREDMVPEEYSKKPFCRDHPMSGKVNYDYLETFKGTLMVCSPSTFLGHLGSLCASAGGASMDAEQAALNQSCLTLAGLVKPMMCNPEWMQLTAALETCKTYDTVLEDVRNNLKRCEQLAMPDTSHLSAEDRLDLLTAEMKLAKDRLMRLNPDGAVHMLTSGVVAARRPMLEASYDLTKKKGRKP